MTRRPLPRARVVAWSTLAMFLAVLALLVFQLRSGRDPALGRATGQGQASIPPPRRVLVRKVLLERVVVHLPAEEADDRPVFTAVRHVTTRTAPPSSAAAAAVPAVAPTAPVPAPLTTRSS